ncbi:hypothetical protein GBA52_011902 [Prunus armeniaca]|nr:hypothetical protein GBA52_011902 [Prunus armeniaca]
MGSDGVTPWLCESGKLRFRRVRSVEKSGKPRRRANSAEENIRLGCDASILLDSSKNIITEERSVPNQNSARGFEVIDEIKSALREEVPQNCVLC